MKLSPIKAAELRRNFAAMLTAFTVEELRWDYHSCGECDSRRMIAEELKRRDASVFGACQRRGGPFVPGMRWRKYAQPPEGAAA